MQIQESMSVSKLVVWLNHFDYFSLSSSFGSVLFFSDFQCSQYIQLLLIWSNKISVTEDGEKLPMLTTFFLTATNTPSVSVWHAQLHIPQYECTLRFPHNYKMDGAAAQASPCALIVRPVFFFVIHLQDSPNCRACFSDERFSGERKRGLDGLRGRSGTLLGRGRNGLNG